MNKSNNGLRDSFEFSERSFGEHELTSTTRERQARDLYKHMDSSEPINLYKENPLPSSAGCCNSSNKDSRSGFDPHSAVLKQPAKPHHPSSFFTKRFHSPITTDMNTLYLKTLYKMPNRSRGPSFAPRREATTGNGLMPGPGHYNTSPKKKAVSGPSFGAAKKLVSEPTKKSVQNDSYYSFGTLHYKKAPKAGYSFCTGTRNLSQTMAATDNSIGPGYYSYKETMVKEKSTAYPMCSDTKSINLNQTFDVSYGLRHEMSMRNPWISNNFQKFGTCPRFTSNKRTKTCILLLIRRKGKQAIVERNKCMVSEEKKEIKLKRLSEMHAKRDSRIQAAKNAKERIESETIEGFVHKLEEQKIQKLLKNERANAWKFCRNWTFLIATLSLLNACSSKYVLRKKARKGTNKYLRIIYICFCAIGKFIRKVRNIRTSKLMGIMSKITRAKIKLWRSQRQSRAKKNIVRYFSMMEDSAVFIIFVKTVIHNVIRIQKWYRRRLAKRILMLGIMNLLWSSLEPFVLNSKTGDRINLRLIEKAVKSYLISGNKSEVVPLPVRLYYICSALKPYQSFVGKRDMIQLVSQALIKRVLWKNIIQIKYKAYPILNIIIK